MKSLAMFLAVGIAAVAAVAATEDVKASRITGSDPVLVTSITLSPPPDGATEAKGEITSVSGTVSAYEPGRLITILRPNATTDTYTIDADSEVPSGLAKGRRVVVRTITRPGVERPLVRKVTYSKTKK